MYHSDRKDRDIEYELELIDDLCESGSLSADEATYLRSTVY